MIDQTQRLQLGEELLRRFAAALRASQLYSSTHPLIARNIRALAATVELLHAHAPCVTIGLLGDEIVVDETPISKAAVNMGELMRRLRSAGIERVILDRGATTDEVHAFVQAVAALEARDTQRGEIPMDQSAHPHIRLGRIEIEQRVQGTLADMASVKRLYSEAVSIAGSVWESALTESKPDSGAARGAVDGLAQAVAQNRTALLALTALKSYDNYTFTHMVNVSILTMGQARGLGIDGPLLREFGLSALMHDIGKVRTPTEILNKPDKLTDAEFTIMKRHTIDGAEILRQTPEMPALSAVVAFEHHLRLDGTGYPDIKRASLNLGTMLCSIADVFDAMRSQRAYQQSFPTDRILAVMHRNDGVQFDQNLVRRFVQLIGIYPAGNMVKLNTGEIAVVVKVYAPDPHRPKVRVLFGSDQARLEMPYDINLWESVATGPHASSVISPVDPAAYQIDPLEVM